MKHRLTLCLLSVVSIGSFHSQVFAGLDSFFWLPFHENSVNITPLVPDSPEIGELLAKIRRESPGFYNLGGDIGNIYLVTDRKYNGVISSFILSDNAPELMTHSMAAGTDAAGVHTPGFCEQIGARLPNRLELETLVRAMGDGGNYGRDAIANLGDNWFWSSSVTVADVPPYAHFAECYWGRYARIMGRNCKVKSSVRCVLEIGI